MKRWALTGLGLFFVTVFSGGWAAAAPACVVCLMAQPGQLTVSDFETKYHQSIAEILERLGGRQEKLKLLRLSLEEAKVQSAKLLEMCKKEKGKLLNKLKSSEELPACSAYVKTAPWELSQERLYNSYSLEVVTKDYREAEQRFRSLSMSKVSNGMSADAVNKDPEVMRWRKLYQDLSVRRDQLAREKARFDQEVPNTAGAPSGDQIEGFMARLGLKPGQAKPECFAKMDADIAREIGCMAPEGAKAGK